MKTVGELLKQHDGARGHVTPDRSMYEAVTEAVDEAVDESVEKLMHAGVGALRVMDDIIADHDSIIASLHSDIHS